MSFNKLGLSDPVMRGVDAAGYDTPTEIQAGAIPPALSGRDVIGQASTGTGKHESNAPISVLHDAELEIRR